MQRIFYLFFSFMLLTGISFSQTETQPYSAKEMGRSFSALAMAQFSSMNPGQDTSVLSSWTEEYATDMAEIMLQGKTEPATAWIIISEAVPAYAEALDNILNGDNSLNFYINQYIKELTTSFSRRKLNLSIQSQIVLLTSNHLEKVYSLLNPGFYNYE